MPDEYVTKLELEATIAKLEQKMDGGFADLKAQIADLAHKIENNQHKDKEQYDHRYLLREENMSEAVAMLGETRFRQACYPVIAEYLGTTDGELKIGCIIDRHLESKRDNATKWINFIKLIAGIAVASGLMYGGFTVNKSNQETQKAMIEFIQRGE